MAKGFWEKQLPGAAGFGRAIDSVVSGGIPASVRQMGQDYGTWGGLGNAINRDANTIRRAAGVPERANESIAGAIAPVVERQLPGLYAPTPPPAQARMASPPVAAVGSSSSSADVYRPPAPPVRTAPDQNVLGTPLLTNRGEGGPRVEYPNDYTRQQYSAPDTGAINALMARTPTAQEYAAERLGPEYVAPTAQVSAGGPAPYIRPGSQVLAAPALQAPWRGDGQGRPTSSFEDIALNAARKGVERLAPQIQYRTVRDGRGNPVQVRVPSTVADVDPNRIYSDTLSTLRYGQPSGGDILQAQIAREGQAADKQRYGSQEEGEMARARMAQEGQRYVADKSYEAATARNETAKEREQRLSDSPEDKAFIEMQKEEFKYLPPEEKAKLGSNPREQWLSYIGKNMAGAKPEGTTPQPRQLKSGGWAMPDGQGGYIDVQQDASGNWVPVGGR